MPFKMDEEERNKLIDSVISHKREFEGILSPLESLNPDKPAVFISVGGGELGDLAITSAKRFYGGIPGGVKTVAFDRYQGFPAQDAADASEVFNMMDGELLEKYLKKYVPDPSVPHAIYLEVEKIDTYRAFRLGTEKGYRVMSTPFGPLVCMDRHATKIMFDRLKLKRVDWTYANDDRGVHKAAKDFGLPVIVKPVMTSSGHGTSIVKTKAELDASYAHAVEHARGIGDEVIVERYLPELKAMGTEITQIVVRHFDENGKIADSFLPPIEHKRPGAVYHESWLPASISGSAAEACKEGAQRIADFMGGLGVYAVEQFVIGDKVYNNEVANRPHDTGLVTRWMLNMDEGGIQLTSTIGLQLNPFSLEISRQGVYGVAHVVLAPPDIEGEIRVSGWDSSRLSALQTKGVRGDFWYFGKPTAYQGRRMGLAVAFQRDLELARRNAEIIAHYAEGCISYGGTS
jgi:phosphoribosylglycinamide formyltransferase 2